MTVFSSKKDTAISPKDYAEIMSSKEEYAGLELVGQN